MLLPLLSLSCVGDPEPAGPGPEVLLRVHDPVRSEVASGRVLFTAFHVEEQSNWALLVGGDGRTAWLFEGEPHLRSVRAHPARDGQSVITVANDVTGSQDVGVIVRHPLDGGQPTTTIATDAHHDLLELDSGFAHIEHSYTRVPLSPLSDPVPVVSDAIRIVSEGASEPGEVLFDFFEDYPADPWWVCDHVASDVWVAGWHEWTHSNSLVRHPTDDAFLMMARYLDAILKIDAATGEVLWQLGGRDSDFELGPGAAFVHGHFSHAFEDRLLIFDNGDDHVRGDKATSRVVELVIDEQQRTAEVAWEYLDPGGKHTGFLGDARRLPGGNTLISFSQQSRITEITPTGDVVWEIEVPGLAVGRVTFWPYEHSARMP